jgi:hypothetical protein
VARGTLLAVLLVAAATPAAGREVTVALHLDPAFVRRTLVHQVYTEPGERTTVWDDGTGCGRLELWDPQVDVDAGRLRITSRGRARVGRLIAGRCLGLTWSGLVEVLEEPELAPDGRAVAFRVVDSNLYDEERRKRLLSGVVWDLVKAHVHPRLAALRIDLGPPLDEVRDWLPLVAPVVESARLRDPRVEEAGLAVTLAFDVTPRPPPPPEPALTEEELRRWDAFLTFVVKQAARDLGPGVRAPVGDVLLDGRYDLLAALAPAEPAAADPVPGLFVRTWERLAPVLRAAEPGLPVDGALRYVGFIAAGDALAALQQLGPEAGLDVSADGLRRLARMLAPGAPDPVAWDVAVDPELRALLGFGPPLPPPPPPPPAPPPAPVSWLLGTAWAAVDPGDLARLDGWVPRRDEIDTYLPLVRAVLARAREQALGGADLAPEFRPVYEVLVPATAWQESCWRQFVLRGGKPVVLQSSRGALGLMQVNQHVWRGLYDLDGLRRDIAYNARAGGEILLHYLRDYAIPSGEHRRPGGTDNLARATYAMYNGGPGHRSRYRSARPRRHLRRIDEAFWRKFTALRDGRELDVTACFLP